MHFSNLNVHSAFSDGYPLFAQNVPVSENIENGRKWGKTAKYEAISIKITSFFSK